MARLTGGAYMALVAGLGCAICQRLGIVNKAVEVHHQRSGTGGGRRASDYRTIPLCYEHHRGDSGVHGLGSKKFARVYGVTESGLVELTWSLLDTTESDVIAWEQLLVDRRVAATAIVTKQTQKSLKSKRVYAWPKRELRSKNNLSSATKSRQLNVLPT